MPPSTGWPLPRKERQDAEDVYQDVFSGCWAEEASAWDGEHLRAAAVHTVNRCHDLHRFRLRRRWRWRTPPETAAEADSGA